MTRTMKIEVDRACEIDRPSLQPHFWIVRADARSSDVRLDLEVERELLGPSQTGMSSNCEAPYLERIYIDM